MVLFKLLVRHFNHYFLNYLNNMTSKMTTIYEDLSNDFTHQTQTYIRRPLVIFKAHGISSQSISMVQLLHGLF